MTLIVVTHENEIANSAPRHIRIRDGRIEPMRLRILRRYCAAVAHCAGLAPSRRRLGCASGCLPIRRQRVESADFRASGHLVRVDASGNRISYPITIKAHWFPGVLRVLVEIGTALQKRRELAQAHPRPHPAGNAAQRAEFDPDCASRRQGAPARCPLTSGATDRSAPDSATRIFLSRSTSGRARRCWKRPNLARAIATVLKSTPGAADRTHYAEIKTWLDHGIGFPVYVEKTLKGSGAVKEFTYFGLRQDGGVWSASQVEAKIRGQAGSTLLIIDRGSAKGKSQPRGFQPRATHAFLGSLMNVFFWIARFGGGFDRRGVSLSMDRRASRPAALCRRGPLGRHRATVQALPAGKGIEADPTVLFEAGIAATNLNWFHIQETVSRFTGTASYDRGGLGWSSPCRTARTPGNIAVELHDMLQCAGIKPPYILVGHSFGGLVMRRFALLYPEEVASMLLVDPMRCEEWPPLNPSKQAEIDRGKKLSRIAIPIARIGLARLAVTSLLCRSGRIAERLAGAAGNGGRHVLGRVTDEVGKMPQGSLAHCGSSLVAPRLLRRYAQPRARRFPTRCGRCRMPSRSAVFPCWC